MPPQQQYPQYVVAPQYAAPVQYQPAYNPYPQPVYPKV